MLLHPERIPTRDKLILTGLYLSKYDAAGLKQLGFESFREAFNVIGYALASRPASIKNYRDEFDPLYPNRRKGWHRRATRRYCLKVYQEYKDLDLQSFTGLIKSLAGYDENAWSEVKPKSGDEGEGARFAKRLVTGLAAERYFEAVQPQVDQFKGYTAENTTRLGCGFDYRLQTGTGRGFLAVEVKGMSEQSGTISLTPKEHEAAAALSDRFFLFVVKNFRESPFHELYQNPLSGALHFKRKERVMVHVSWLTTV